MVAKIGKYQIIRHIGSGGMADLFLVEGHGPGGFSKQLCLKKIRKEYSERLDFIKSFESEARIVAGMHHPNIIQVFEFERHQGELYLVMEYVDGLDLRRILAIVADLHLQLPLDFAVYVMEGLLAALDHAHNHKENGRPVPVIHRDVSPHNILISAGGVVKLADFGIAKAKGGSTTTQTGIIKGKLSYLSPEQIEEGGASIGPASDLFSAGVVMWESITSERLFKATMEHQVVAKVLSFTQASFPFLSDRFNQFLSGLLARNPAERFASAEAALHALRRIGVQPCNQSDAAQLIRKFKLLMEQETKPQPAANSGNAESIATNVAHPSQQQDRIDQSVLSKLKTRIDPPTVPSVTPQRFARVGRAALMIGVVCLILLLAYAQLKTDKDLPSEHPSGSIHINTPVAKE